MLLFVYSVSFAVSSVVVFVFYSEGTHKKNPCFHGFHYFNAIIFTS